MRFFLSGLCGMNNAVVKKELHEPRKVIDREPAAKIMPVDRNGQMNIDTNLAINPNGIHRPVILRSPSELDE